METVCCHFLVLQIFWVCDLITQGNEYSGGRKEGEGEGGGGDDYRPKLKSSRKALDIKIVCVMIVVDCCL